jgi:hypothetical protein
MAQFVAELKAFDGRRAVVQQMRRQIRKPVPKVREAIKRHAIAILPKSGGLGEWVARANVTATIRYGSARSAGVRMKGSRRSKTQVSDLNRLDRGRVRAPSWGHRTSASWHNQTVPAGFFTDPVTDSPEWRAEIERAVDTAFDQIRRG